MNMESTACSLDELLCQSLSLYRQNRFYDDCLESEQKASHMLEEAWAMVHKTKNCADMAKLGCILECLVQKFYIDYNTDKALDDVDTTLIAFWKKNEASCMEVFSVYLWFGYYFLLRFRNKQSVFHSRNKRMMAEIISFLTDTFRRFKTKSMPVEVLSLFSPDVWSETVCWVEQVHDSCLCEKQALHLLQQLYDLGTSEVSQERLEQDALLQQIVTFYCF